MLSENFLETTKDIGRVNEKQTVDVYFKRKNIDRRIISIDVDCTRCLTGHDQINSVMIRYKAGKVQPQVLETGANHQPIDRGATVNFSDGTSERLEIFGTLVKVNV